MAKLNWLTAYQLITKETVLFIHKIFFNNQPPTITNLITFSLCHSQNVRSVRKPIIKEEHNPSMAKKSIIFMGIYLYNKLTYDITCKNTKLLSKYLQKNIQYHYDFDRLPKYEPGLITHPKYSNLIHCAL